MKRIGQYFDKGALAVIVTTFILFVAALFTQGMTHDILLEAGVLLVSVKLIMMAYKNAVIADTLHEKLDAIYVKLGCHENEKP